MNPQQPVGPIILNDLNVRNVDGPVIDITVPVGLVSIHGGRYEDVGTLLKIGPPSQASESPVKASNPATWFCETLGTTALGVATAVAAAGISKTFGWD